MTFMEILVHVIDTQGIVAALLLISIWHNHMTSGKLLAKNCELNAFIMKCLERELAEEHTVPQVALGYLRGNPAKSMVMDCNRQTKSE